MIRMLRCLTIIIFLALLSSCAKPPYQELDAAEYMVSRARALEAMEFSPAEYLAAKAALEDAQKSMQERAYGDARNSLEFSLKHARRAAALAREGLAKRADEEAQRAIEAVRARQEAMQKNKEAELARKVQEVAETQKKTEPEPKPEPKPEIVPVSSYNVGEGETLWTISAQPQVYNEGLLWPLLYQANRDQIKDPRQIFPGQVLSIRRDMTPKELEEARQKARESNIFPVPEAAPDKQ